MSDNWLPIDACLLPGIRDLEGLIFLLLSAGLLTAATFLAPAVWLVFLIGLTLCLVLRAMGRLSFLSHPFLSFPARFGGDVRSEPGFEYLLNDALGRIMALALVLNFLLATAIFFLTPGSYYVFLLENIPDHYREFLITYWLLPDPSWDDLFFLISLSTTVFWHYVLLLLYVAYAEREARQLLSSVAKVLGICVFVAVLFLVSKFGGMTEDGLERGELNWIHSNEYTAFTVLRTIVTSMAGLAATFLLFVIAFVLPARLRAALGYGKPVSEVR